MIFPAASWAVVLLLAVSALCWGSWANAQKLSQPWRFELFYYDFALGAAVCAVIAAFTLGSLNTQDLTFQDNFLLTGYRKMAWAAGAGIVFNLGNMLLAGAVSAVGMTAALPIGLGLALAGGVFLNYAVNGEGGNIVFLIAGAILVLLAIVVTAFACIARQDSQRSAAAPTPSGARAPKSRKASAGAGITLAILSGILMAALLPMTELARLGDTGVAPYGLALLFAVGVLGSTILYAPFFMNFPVHGAPIELKHYFKGTKKKHLLGLLAGIVWMAGTAASLVATEASGSFHPGPTVVYTVEQAGALVSVLWGLLVWREFKDSNERVRVLMSIVVVLLAAGMGAIAAAPYYMK
ncbi:MAG TPA: GRP family sugar transporter [Bryobacteraceae bacterium]|nr:GRP family sugar transporter [Bryobacteraceae bacterium]